MRLLSIDAVYSARFLPCLVSVRFSVSSSTHPIVTCFDRHLPCVVKALFAALVIVTITMLGNIAPAWAEAAGVELDMRMAASAPQEKFGDLYGIIFGLFIGIMTAASIYLLFIWLIIRDRGQVFLMLMLVFLGISVGTTNTVLMDYLGLQSDTMLGLLQNYSMILAYISGILFTWYFLDLDSNVPAMREPLLILSGLLLLTLLYSAFDQRPIRFALPTLGTLSLSAILVAGVITLRFRTIGSLTHITAFLFFLFGIVTEPMYDLGLITDARMGNNIIYAAFGVAALLFAVVIAGQFAARQEEKERALAISNERFALAARGANEGMFDWHLAKGEVFFSDQFRKILGLPSETEADARHGIRAWVKMIKPEDRMRLNIALRSFRNNRKAIGVSFEYRIVVNGDTVRWLHTKIVATRDKITGKVLRFVGSVSDITARKNSEADLKASEARFRGITEAHPVPVLIARLADNIIMYASPSADALVTVPTGELLGKRLSFFILETTARDHIISTLSKGDEINLYEINITRANGAILPAAVSARRINYQDQPAAVIGIYDLTERKEAEEQIARQQEALQQSEKMAALGGLLAGVAHELNNPLSVVVGQATLLSEGTDEPKVKTRAEKIFKAADRCARIVKSFLAMARRKPPEMKATDLNAIINASLELLGYQFRNANVIVTLELDPALPEVRGDSDHLMQVFTNLAMNAVQALQEWPGKHALTIRTRAVNGEIVTTIADSGPGIPLDLRVKIFEPFFTTRAATGGTGVGLALCVGIIENHDGKIKVEDTTGGGATFVVTLPIATAATTSSVAPSPSVTKNADDIHHANTLRLLIVDDELELAQTLADLLEPEGYQITLAINGAIAIEKLRGQTYDAIISDLRMPVMDGPAMYDEMARSLPQYLNKIIYVTGDTLSVHVNEFLRRVSAPVIEKPYRLIDVKNALATVLPKSTSSATYSAGQDQ